MAAKTSRPGLVERTPLAEWTAAGLGLVLTVSMLGYSLWEATQAGGATPSIVVRQAGLSRSAGGYVLEIEARNTSLATAAAVEVRGELRRGGAVVEESRVTFDYVPGQGRARGGLFFERDPRGYQLTLRPEGYAEP